jgi:hypothetical protein
MYSLHEQHRDAAQESYLPTFSDVYGEKGSMWRHYRQEILKKLQVHLDKNISAFDQFALKYMEEMNVRDDFIPITDIVPTLKSARRLTMLSAVGLMRVGAMYREIKQENIFGMGYITPAEEDICLNSIHRLKNDEAYWCTDKETGLMLAHLVHSPAEYYFLKEKDADFNLHWKMEKPEKPGHVLLGRWKKNYYSPFLEAALLDSIIHTKDIGLMAVYLTENYFKTFQKRHKSARAIVARRKLIRDLKELCICCHTENDKKPLPVVFGQIRRLNGIHRTKHANLSKTIGQELTHSIEIIGRDEITASFARKVPALFR